MWSPSWWVATLGAPAVVLSACGPQIEHLPCEDRRGCLTGFAVAHGVTGTATFGGSDPVTTVTLGDGSPCVVTMSPQADAASLFFKIDATVTCESPNQQLVIDTVLADLRSWPPGATQPSDALVTIHVRGGGYADCTAWFQPYPMTTVVDDHVGTATLAPPFVTPDYHRHLHLMLPTTPLSIGPSNSSCSPQTVTFGLDLRFEQTVADFHYDPNGPCPCGE